MASKKDIKIIGSLLKKEYRAGNSIGTKKIDPDPNIQWAPHRLLFFTATTIIHLDNDADGGVTTMRLLMNEVPMLKEINMKYNKSMGEMEAPGSIEETWKKLMKGVEEGTDYEVRFTPITVTSYGNKEINTVLFKVIDPVTSKKSIRGMNPELAKILVLTKTPAFLSKKVEGMLYSIGNGMKISVFSYTHDYTNIAVKNVLKVADYIRRKEDTI